MPHSSWWGSPEAVPSACQWRSSSAPSEYSAGVPGWSSRTSHPQGFISCQRSLFDDRRTLLNVDQRLARGRAAEGDALVMLPPGHDLVTPQRRRMKGDPFGAVAHFHLAVLLPHPTLLADIL